MCCVIPPASPATTSVRRIASRSEVFPWSTWPMIVTTGRPRLQLLLGVLVDDLLRLVLGRAHDLDLLVELVGEDLDRLVGQRLGERRHLAELHQLLDHLGAREAERLGHLAHGGAGVDLEDLRLVLDDGRLLGRLVEERAAAAATAAAGRALRGRRAHRLAARRLRVDDDAPALAGPSRRRLTRRRRARGARAGPDAAPGRRRTLRRRLRGGGFAAALGLGFAFGLLGGRVAPPPSSAFAATSSSTLEAAAVTSIAGVLQLREDLLAGEASLLGDLVDPLLRHYSLRAFALDVAASSSASAAPASCASAPSSADFGLLGLLGSRLGLRPRPRLPPAPRAGRLGLLGQRPRPRPRASASLGAATSSASGASSASSARRCLLGWDAPRPA